MKIHPSLLAILAFALPFCGCADEAATPKGNKNMEHAYTTDTFKTPGGKEVVITAIKHASLRIQFDGLEIQVDPVGAKCAPATDYAAFPKADIILVTHEHFDHFDRDAIAALRKDGTALYANPAVQGMLGAGTALKNREQVLKLLCKTVETGDDS